jgi:hypothetical protein
MRCETRSRTDIIKLYQWRQDVLHGPYIMTDDRRNRRKRPSNSRR